MSNDPSARRLLPQNSQLGQFSFAPPTYPPTRETQKNYVFVDEHNRHKRLKVMRACEGCRRRKIKCDAATTNTWPCSACIRLKLHCVRPNGQYDDSPTSDSPYDLSQAEYEAAQLQDTYRHIPMQQPPLMGGQSKSAGYGGQGSYSESHDVYSNVHYSSQTGPQPGMHYTTMPATVGALDPSYATAGVYAPSHMHASQAESPESYQHDQYAQQDLAELLGSLRVDERGTAPYLSKLALRNLEDEPAVEEDDEYEAPLPPITSGPGLKIRIPPELMPDDEMVLQYFDLYFANVHPYVPVLDKAQLYHQWHNSRESISPLILEAIFAVAGRLADEPALGQQWITLATKHADAFMDVPRLSTLQALLIILKAREASPKRGYYYRSWMSVVNCIAMAKDLGLDEHYEDHQEGKACGSSASECLTKSRIWQTAFVCEVMIGTAQGREELSVNLQTVDFNVPRPIAGGDDSEYHAGRNFTYLARIVRQIKVMNNVYSKIKRRKDWGIDPEFVQLNPSLNAWLNDLPPDMTVTFPPGGAPPWLPSHFIGNLHSYYHLAVVLLHRPQLSFLDPQSGDGQWKVHMLLCHSSAKSLCRLQESMLQTYGLSGLQCMQRGISFTIYAILACIVLHIVALTSPDPDLSTDAREYFERHMRILERTMGSWPIPEMVKQIDAVREAFSADTRKPFALRPSFPYGSPSPSSHSSPPRAGVFRPPTLRTTSIEPGMDAVAGQHSQSLAMISASQSSQPSAMPHGISVAEAPSWNPSRIFDQWHTTFGAPELPAVQTMTAAGPSMSPAHAMPPHQEYSAPPAQTFVTPAMWQESVASVYEGGLKRAWDYDGGVGGSMQKRR